MTTLSKLTDHNGYLLRMVSNAVSHEFARKLVGAGVTVAEWAMLRALADSDRIAPSVLSRRMGMTKGAISKLADRLIEKGLIERTENADDKRAHRLSLSDAGRAKVPMLAALADRNDADFFAALGDADRARLRDILNLLIRAHDLSGVPVD